jgi:hypothetical protein
MSGKQSEKETEIQGQAAQQVFYLRQAEGLHEEVRRLQDMFQGACV